MKLTSFLLIPALASTLLLACGDDEELTPAERGFTADGKDDTCATFCDTVAECEDTSLDDCVESCTDNNAVSRNGQNVLTECFEDVSCNVGEEDLLPILACVQDGAEDLALSEVASTYCEETVPALRECGTGDGSAELSLLLGDCDEYAPLLADDVLAELNECAEKECNNALFCVLLQMGSNVDLDTLESGDDPSIQDTLTLLAFAAVLADTGLAGEEGVDVPLLGQPDPADPDPSEPEPDPGLGGASALSQSE